MAEKDDRNKSGEVTSTGCKASVVPTTNPKTGQRDVEQVLEFVWVFVFCFLCSWIANRPGAGIESKGS